jgi:hypothetical protein
MGNIQRADPTIRRTVFVVLGAGVAIAAAILLVASRFRGPFEAWLVQDLRSRTIVVFAALTVISAGPVLGLAGYLWRLGQRVATTGRYPPPGLRVVNDTEIVDGLQAARVSRAMKVFGSVLATAALVLAAFLWRLVFVLLPE